MFRVLAEHYHEAHDFTDLRGVLNRLARRYPQLRQIAEEIPQYRPLFEIPYAIDNEGDALQYAHCIQQLNRLGISNETIATCFKILDSYALPLFVYCLSYSAISSIFSMVSPWAANGFIKDVMHLFSLYKAFRTLSATDIQDKQAQLNRIVIKIVDALLMNPDIMEALLRMQNQWNPITNLQDRWQTITNFVNEALSRTTPTSNKHIKQLEGLGFPLELVPDEYNCGVFKTIMECPVKLGGCATLYDRRTIFSIANRRIPVDSHSVVQPFPFADPTTREERIYPTDVHLQESLGNEIQAYVDALTEGIKNAKNASTRCFGLFKRNLSSQEYAALSARAVEVAKQRVKQVKLAGYLQVERHR